MESLWLAVGSPLMLPIAFGLGTAVPVAVFSIMLATGIGLIGTTLDRMQVFEVWARRVTALVILGIGIYETCRSTFYLI